MNAYKIFLILAAASFFIGALTPCFRIGGPPNWTDLGLGFVVVAWIVGGHFP
jgi:hypothetical protein